MRQRENILTVMLIERSRGGCLFLLPVSGNSEPLTEHNKVGRPHSLSAVTSHSPHSIGYFQLYALHDIARVL